MSTPQTHLEFADAILADSLGYPYHAPESETAALMVSARAAAAQAQATIALVEATERLADQQHVANLLAYAQINAGNRAVVGNLNSAWGQIRAALGLEEDGTR